MIHRAAAANDEEGAEESPAISRLDEAGGSGRKAVAAG
jgi:hypothetical protein